MNTQDIIKLIEQGEGVSVEFKTAKHNLPNNLFETVCAFLNHNGGHILLGVKDDGTVEGIRNIVKYSKAYAHSTPIFEDDNMFEVKIPLVDGEQVGEQVREQVREHVREQVTIIETECVIRLLSVISKEHSISELMTLLQLSGRRNFIEKYISPVLKDGLIEMSQPNSPNSPTQKYRLTTRGEQVKEHVGEQVREQVGEQVSIIETECVIRLLSVISKEHSTNELMTLLQLSGRRNFIEKYISPALKDGLIEMSQPDSPNSPTQKYRLTAKGKQIQQIILNNE